MYTRYNEYAIEIDNDMNIKSIRNILTKETCTEIGEFKINKKYQNTFFVKYNTYENLINSYISDKIIGFGKDIKFVKLIESLKILKPNNSELFKSYHYNSDKIRYEFYHNNGIIDGDFKHYSLLEKKYYLDFKTSFVNGKPNGYFVSYFPTGKIENEGYFVDGIQTCVKEYNF